MAKIYKMRTFMVLMMELSLLSIQTEDMLHYVLEMYFSAFFCSIERMHVQYSTTRLEEIFEAMAIFP